MTAAGPIFAALPALVVGLTWAAVRLDDALRRRERRRYLRAMRRGPA